MTHPILGLYSPETGGRTDCFSAERMIRAALRRKMEAVLIDFPERRPDAEEVRKQLRRILPELEGKMRRYISCSLNGSAGIADFRAALEQKLKWLGLSRSEGIVFGPVSGQMLARLKKTGFAAFLQEEKSGGRFTESWLWIAGRSEVVEEAARAFPDLTGVRFCYSPLDLLDRPGSYGYAAAKNGGLSVMISGADRAGNRPELKAAWEKNGRSGTLEDQLLLWMAQMRKDLNLVVEPSSEEEMESRLSAVQAAETGEMSVREKLALNELKDVLRDSSRIRCSACGCCMPCPYGVDIPGMMAACMEYAEPFGRAAAEEYLQLLELDQKECRFCARCVEQCPRGNRIPDYIREIRGEDRKPQ